MDDFFGQVYLAAQQSIYFLALAGALMIPDICGAADTASGEASGSTYRAWFDEWMAPLHPGFMDGDDCYKFRCSLLHQGTTQHPKGGYSRILFVEPGHGMQGHMNVLNDALWIDPRRFSEEMVQAALRWRETVKGTEPYESNAVRFVTRYPTGLFPYIVGVPVIS